MSGRTCPKCNAIISRLVAVCPHCGEKFSTGSGTAIGLGIGLLVLAGVVGLVVLASGGLHLHKTEPPVQTVTVKQPPKPEPAPAPPPKPTPPEPEPTPPQPEPAPKPKPELAKGMTMDQVREALGKPDRASGAFGAGMRWDWWTYNSGEKLRFVNSVLDGWSKVTPTPAPSAPTIVGAASGASEPASGEARRKQIYGALKGALKSAQVIASGPTVSADQRSVLEQAFTAQVRSRYGIRGADATAILAEGDSKKWPAPSLLLKTEAKGTPPAVGKAYTLGSMVQLLQSDGPPTDNPPKGVYDASAGLLVRVMQVVPARNDTWYEVGATDPSGRIIVSGWASGLKVIDTADARPVGAATPGGRPAASGGSAAGTGPGASGHAAGPSG